MVPRGWEIDMIHTTSFMAQEWKSKLKKIKKVKQDQGLGTEGVKGMKLPLKEWTLSKNIKFHFFSTTLYY